MSSSRRRRNTASAYITPSPVLLPLNPNRSFELYGTGEAALCLWLENSPNRIPPYASHKVGVAGMVLNQKRDELLVVREVRGETWSRDSPVPGPVGSRMVQGLEAPWRSL